MTITFSHTAINAFVTTRAHRGSRFELDQFLQRPTRQLADQINTIAHLERSKKFGQGRIVLSHRCVLLWSARLGTHQGSRRWLT